MKRNQKPNHYKNCTPMQNTEEGEGRYCKYLLGKGKGTNHYRVHVIHRLEQVPKRVVQKQAKGNWL